MEGASGGAEATTTGARVCGIRGAESCAAPARGSGSATVAGLAVYVVGAALTGLITMVEGSTAPAGAGKTAAMSSEPLAASAVDPAVAGAYAADTMGSAA